MQKRRILTQYNSVYLILAFICLCALVYQPGFFRYDNVNMMLRQASALGILTMGHVFVISCGCVDLSAAATMQVSIAVFMSVTKAFGDAALIPGILLSIVVALLIGLLNGYIVEKRGVQPFLATLFMGAILVGVMKITTGSTPLGVPPQALISAVKGSGVISNCIFMFAGVAAVAYVVLSRTVFGRQIMMVGTNRCAAKFSGINVDRTIIISYCICALTAVLAGIVGAGYLGFADQTTIGKGMEMDSMVAAVLGGNFLSGGRASVSGAIGGVLAMTLMLNIVILFGLDIQFQYVLKGVILLAVVFISARNAGKQ